MTAPSATLTHANGAAHPAPPLSLQPRGPVRPWPRTRVPEPPAGARLLPLVALPRHAPAAPATSGSDTSASDTAPPVVVPEERLLRIALAALSRLRAPSADTVITWSMAATVALVAVDAAIVSYSHIYGLATGHWGTGVEVGVQARLLPLSIDGVIAEASLVKLYRARHKIVRLKAGWWKLSLATFMLWLGIVATIAANVTHGLPTTLLPPVAHTIIMALLSAWPAGALIGSMEMAMGLVRDKQTVAEGDASESGSDTETDSGGPGRPRRRTPRRPTPKPRRNLKPIPASKPPVDDTPPPPDDSDAVAKAIREHPAWKARRRLSRDDKDGIAKALGVTRRTVERRITDLRAPA